MSELNNAKNKRNGKVHHHTGYQGLDELAVILCGGRLADWEETEEPIDCQGCLSVIQQSEDDDEEYDPMGLIPDDIPDGAWHAMHYEIYGW